MRDRGFHHEVIVAATGVAYALAAGVVALAAFAASLGPAVAAVPGMRPVVA